MASGKGHLGDFGNETDGMNGLPAKIAILVVQTAEGENPYGRSRQSERFLKVVLGGAVEFPGVSGLDLRLSTLRTLMAISRVESKSAVRVAVSL